MEFKNKKANLIVSDVVFLILVIVFILILMIFVSKQSSNLNTYEETLTKEIVLAMDSLKAGTEVKFYAKEYLDQKERNVIEVIKIDNDENYVFVQLSQKSGYKYGFFNDLDFTVKIEGEYIILEAK